MAKTILLVEDSVTMQKVVEMTFAAENFEVVAMGSGEEALKKATELKPALVIADLSMDGLTGYDVCEGIKTDPELDGVPVLLLHGNAAPFEKKRGDAVGADGEIAKPFETQTLIDRVKQLTAEAPEQAQPEQPAEEPSPATEEPSPAAEELFAATIDESKAEKISIDIGSLGKTAEVPVTPPPEARPPDAEAAPPPEAPAPRPRRPSVPTTAPGRRLPPFPPPRSRRTTPPPPPQPSRRKPARFAGQQPAAQDPSQSVEITIEAELPPPSASEELPSFDTIQPPPADREEPPTLRGIPAPDLPPPPAGMSLPTPQRPTLRQAPVADISDQMARQALERVAREVIERVAWEVVPELAEKIIRQELDRLVEKPRS